MNYGGSVFSLFCNFVICLSATWQRDKSRLETNEEVLKRRRKRRSLLIDESHSTLIIWTMISFKPRPRSSTTGESSNLCSQIITVFRLTELISSKVDIEHEMAFNNYHLKTNRKRYNDARDAKAKSGPRKR